MILTIIAKPNAKITKISSWRDTGTALIDIAAPPIDGLANQELIRFLAKSLKIPKSAIIIKRGQIGKVKHVQLPAQTNLRLINSAI